MMMHPIDEGESSGSNTSQDDASSTDEEASQENAAIEEKSQPIAAKETNAVCGLRLLIFVILILSAVVVTFLIYYTITGYERALFEVQFKEDANKVLQSIGASLDLTLGGIDALVVSMVSHARATNQNWPYVTIPDFGARAEKIRSLTNAVYLNMYMYVPAEERTKWEAYSAVHGKGWVEESLAFQERSDIFQNSIKRLNATNVTYWNVIHDYDEWGKEDAGTVGLDPSDPGPFLPMWQTQPLVPVDPPYNWDLMSVPLNESIFSVFETHTISITEAYLIAFENDTASIAENEREADWINSYITTGEEPMEPISDIYYPILKDSADYLEVHRDDYNASENKDKLGGFVSVSIYWRDMMKGILPEGSNGIVVVVHNPCNPSFSYQINGPEVAFLGVKDAHDPKYDYLSLSTTLVELDDYSLRGRAYTGVPVNKDFCPYTLRVYPSEIVETAYTSPNALIYSIVAVMIFLFTSIVFFLYDFCVEKRNKVVMKAANTTYAIVSSIFPANIRERVFEVQARQAKAAKAKRHMSTTGKPMSHESEFLTASKRDKPPDDASHPIAEHFPETTVLFADLSGFTSWSSTREPWQVFLLLERVYGCFDRIARRRGVFKVETVGDCYVAVTGLPKPRKNHAVVITRFAADCREALNEITRGLELTLGPGTGDLLLRIGLNSGSITAGVLRGDKARFQLFGDTVNTASRMESQGKPNKIQCSQKTALLLIDAGKEDWVKKRSDLIEAKGKGKMQTYWVEPKQGVGGLVSREEVMTDFSLTNRSMTVLSKTDRLIDWNTSVFEELLRNVMAHRIGSGVESGGHIKYPRQWSTGGKTVRDDVSEAISLRQYTAADNKPFPRRIEITSVVLQQLRSYISVIAHGYRANSFHNFDHASHVAMTTKKLLQRMNDSSRSAIERGDKGAPLGIGDPLAELAVVYAALIHDVDHKGIPNEQLLLEDVVLATRYKTKSVAEQNSFDIAWNLLMEQSYDELRACMFACQEDLSRFRQIGINAVMATDIFDPDLKADRHKRWERVFSEGAPSNEQETINRKGTIMLEHIIQAGDLWHCMHDWTIYQKWNRRLFSEMYGSFLAGRATVDPSLTWYEAEMAFFDNYIIPLARKLKAYQVFGVSIHELFDCASDNRMEWEAKGRAIVAEMKETHGSSISVEV